jgi:hypothetical protein
MQISIRMIGIATTVFWIFLIGFAASAAYSVKDVQFNFGQPTADMTVDNKLLFSLPITLLNKGYYNIAAFKVTTEISDVEGTLITRGSTLIPVIRKGEAVTATHNMTIDADDLLNGHQNLLFNDTELRLNGTVGLKLAEVIPVEASANFTVPWGAPLYNFTLGTPTFSTYNLTHLLALIPISFENHAFFDLTGTIQTSIYNSSNMLMSKGQTDVNTSQHAHYHENLELYLPVTSMTPSGYFQVNLQTPFFNYITPVIHYG